MNFIEESIPEHAMAGRRLSRRGNLVVKTLQHLPHLSLNIPGRRRSSEDKNTKVGEDKSKVVIDSAIGSAPVHLTERPAQEFATIFSTISKADESEASKPISGRDADKSPSTLAIPRPALEITTPPSTVPVADFLGSSEPIGVLTTGESRSAFYTRYSGLGATSNLPAILSTDVNGSSEPIVALVNCESPSAIPTSSPRHLRRHSLLSLVPKVLRPRSPKSPTSLQHGRIPDTPGTLELNPVALEELWTCPDYFFKQNMPGRVINPKCKHHEDRSSMDEIFYLDVEESWTSPGLMVCTRRRPQYMYGAVDPLLPAYSPPTAPLSSSTLASSSLSIHCDPEQIERETFADPFDFDREEGEERGDSSGMDTDSVRTDASLERETDIRTHAKRAVVFSSREDCTRRHSLFLWELSNYINRIHE